MFEAAELGRKISKDDYKAQLPELRVELLQTQFALSQTQHPVIIIISGVDAAGRGEVVNSLNEWLDTRGLQSVAFEEPTEEERERPKYWRYWMSLPGRGRIGIFFGAWYVEPITQYAYGNLELAEVDELLAQIRRFETLLVQDGAIIIKFWLHLSRQEQVKRLKKVEKDPNSLRQVSEQDWKHVRLYEQFAKAAEHAIRHTDSGDAPWHLVESTDWRYRDLSVGRTVMETLKQHLERVETTAHCASGEDSVSEAPMLSVAETSPKAQLTVLDHVNLSQKLSRGDYNRKLNNYQAKLHQLAWAAHANKLSTILVFEGWDAAGKGGAIRRITQAMDARLYQVISTAAPTDEERAHHYLWRFWRHIPRAGRFTAYDRSWYGRVLVERVEGFAKEHEWKRSFMEINNFEEAITKDGTLLLKFWLHLSPEEQLARFQEREKTPYKKHKITEEDWRNRERWDAYKIAVNDMVARTSTHFAPWQLVAGEDKRFARIEIIKTLCERLEQALEQRTPGSVVPPAATKAKR